MKILVVDDTDAVLEVLFDVLSLDHEVIVENDPEQVMKYFDNSFDLVITDYDMPYLNGLVLSKKIKDKFDIPIIMLSGTDFGDIKLKSIDYFIAKPFQIKHIKETIKSLGETNERRTY